MDRFFSFIGKHAKSVIISVLVITAFMLIQAVGISINASYSAFVPWDENTDVFIGGISGQKIVRGTERSDKEEESVEVKQDSSVEVAPEELESEEPSANEAETSTAAQDDSEEDLPYTATYLLLVGGDDIYSPENLNLLNSCLAEFSSFRDVGEPYSVFDFFTFEKVGTRLGVVPIDSSGNEAWTTETASILEERITTDPILRYFLVSGDADHFLFYIPIASVSSSRLDEFSDVFNPLREAGLDVYINGGPVITAKIMEYLYKDLSTLLILCLVAIGVVYYFCFRSKRSVLIPGSLSIIGLIWTLGTMKLLSIDITILNIVTPCMVLTLGSAYSIYILSDYYAAFRNGEAVSAIAVAKKILGTIFLACLTTIAGFLCLTVSRTSGLKDFGISVSFGLAFCAVLSFTYLPAILTLVPQPGKKQIARYTNGIMARFVNKLSSIVIRYWWVLLIVFVCLFVSFVCVKDRIPLDSNYMSYFPENDPFGQESRGFAREMGGTSPYRVTIKAPNNEAGFFLESDNLEAVKAYEDTVIECPDILQSISFTNYLSFANKTMNGDASIPSNRGLIIMLSRLVMMLGQYNSQVSMIVDDDFSQVTLIIQHWDSVEKDLMTTASIERSYQALVDALPLLPDGTTVSISGDPIANFKFSNRLVADQSLSTILSVLIVLLITAFVFRSLRYGILTIVPVLSGIMINYVFMFIAGIPFDMVTVSFSSIAIGCGVDDAIHFMFRFRDKHSSLNDAKKALESTMKETGRAIIMTTISIVVGMMMLSFASYTPIRYFGLLMSVTLFGCMASTLLFMPPFTILTFRIQNRLIGLKHHSSKRT